MERVEGVVTRVLRYGDRQWVVHVFTRERGFLSLFATGSGRRGVVARCMEVGEVVYVEGRGGGGGRGNGGGGMGRLVSFDREMETMGIWGDVVRANVALLWGEVLEVVTRDAGVNEELFSLVRYGVEYLGTEGVEAGNFNLWFLWRLARVLGVGVEAGGYREGWVFCVEDGCFHEVVPVGRVCVGPRASGVIARLCGCGVEELGVLVLNGEGRRMLLDVVLRFLGFHLGVDLDTRGIRVIREVFT